MDWDFAIKPELFFLKVPDLPNSTISNKASRPCSLVTLILILWLMLVLEAGNVLLIRIVPAEVTLVVEAPLEVVGFISGVLPGLPCTFGFGEDEGGSGEC